MRFDFCQFCLIHVWSFFSFFWTIHYIPEAGRFVDLLSSCTLIPLRSKSHQIEYLPDPEIFVSNWEITALLLILFIVALMFFTREEPAIHAFYYQLPFRVHFGPEGARPSAFFQGHGMQPYDGCDQSSRRQLWIN